MTEQTRNITEAVIAKSQEDKLYQLRKEKSERYLQEINRHLKRLRSLHKYGSTLEDVNNHKADSYFSTWFEDAENGDIHAMHSILDHFEPLEVITNLGHNYRSRFSPHEAEIILDFRPGDVIPKKSYELSGSIVKISPITYDEKTKITKSYLFSSILRMAKELILYFPMNKISFNVNCADLDMKRERFEVTDEQVKYFLTSSNSDQFIEDFDLKVINK